MDPRAISDRRWQATEAERRMAEDISSAPLGPAAVARILVRSPRIIPDALRLAAGAAYAGMWSSSGLRALLNSERAGQLLPHLARGAALWAPEEPFVSTLSGLLSPDARALEIGCGSGRISRHVSPRVGALVCSDVSTTMLRDTQCTLRGYEDVEYVLLDGRSLMGLPDGGFDLVYAHAVLYFFDLVPALGMLDEIRRVLAPGGKCVLSFRVIDDSRSADDALQDARRVRARGLGSGRFRPYTEAQVSSMFELAQLPLTSSVSSEPDSIGGYTVFIGAKT